MTCSRREKDRVRVKTYYWAHREARLAYTSEYNKTHQQERAIRAKTGRHIRLGNIKVPDRCELCGANNEKLYAHHHSYKPADWKRVCFCCQPCHISLHKRILK